MTLGHRGFWELVWGSGFYRRGRFLARSPASLLVRLTRVSKIRCRNHFAQPGVGGRSRRLWRLLPGLLGGTNAPGFPGVPDATRVPRLSMSAGAPFRGSTCPPGLMIVSLDTPHRTQRGRFRPRTVCGLGLGLPYRPRDKIRASCLCMDSTHNLLSIHCVMHGRPGTGLRGSLCREGQGAGCGSSRVVTRQDGH